MRNASKLIATDIVDAIMGCQALIHKKEVGAQQVHHTAIFTEHAVDEQLHLRAERRA